MGARSKGVVTAVSLANGLGSSTEAILDAIFQGRTAFTAPLEAFAPSGPTVCLAGPTPPLPARFREDDTRIHRLTWAGLRELEPAVARAVARWGSDRVAVVLGSSTGGLEATEAAFHERSVTGTMPGSFDFDRMHPVHRIATFAARVLGAQGPTHAVSTACSSSAKALASALRLLALGVCDAVVTGGVDSLCSTTLRGFHALGILAEEGCRPFDARRSGITIGEGSAFLLVEREGPGLAELLAVGESSDAFHLSAPEPTGRGARSCMQDALARAGLLPDAIGYVNAHGTGTPQNDAAEAAALLALFGDRVPVSSTKGVTGHMLGAAGGIEAIVGVAALTRGLLPPNTGCDEPDPAAAGLDLVRRPRAATPRYVLSNSFAFGGNNASVLLGAMP